MLFQEFLETDFEGSLYHPNLLNFDISLENGLEQTKEKFQPTLQGELNNSYLNQFHFASYFLRKKPYAFSLLADRSRKIENREFFERQVVEATRYAGNFGLRNTFIPVNFSFSNSSKTIDRVSRPSQNFDDDELNLSLSNEAKRLGTTRFEANQNEFSRTESGTADQSGTARNFSLSNQKPFSDDNKKLLYSFLRYYTLTGTSENSVVNLNEDLAIEHSDDLSSSYTYTFSDRDSSGVKNKDNRFGFNLRHQLYESLASSFNTYYFNSDGSAFSQDIYGISLDENYTKKLGVARLNLGIGTRYSEENRDVPSGIISIIDESHALTTGTVTLLAQPNVDTATVVVTDTTQTTTLTLNVDYQLSSVGQQTQIQRIATGSIANGQEVLVDYQAKSPSSVSFNTLGNNFLARIDFFENLIGVFYRVNKESHPKKSDTSDLILQTLTDTSAGVEFNYKNLSVLFEDKDYRSSLSPFKRQQLRESFFFHPSAKSTLTFQSSQTIVRLVDTRDTQKFFDLLSRYSIGLSRYSRFHIEAGFRTQEGSGIDLDDFVAGSGYELDIGKLEMGLQYDFKKQLFLDDELENHFFSFKLKRTF